MKLKRTNKLLALLLTLVMLVGLLPTMALPALADDDTKYQVTFKASSLSTKGKLILTPLDEENADDICIAGANFAAFAGVKVELKPGQYKYQGYNSSGQYMGSGKIEVSKENQTVNLQYLTISLQFIYQNDLENPPSFSSLNGSYIEYECTKDIDLEIVGNIRARFPATRSGISLIPLPMSVHPIGISALELP